MKILRIAALALFVAASLSAERLALLDNGLRLLFIDSSAPSVTLATVTVTGMQAGETLAAIDYRPSNGVLYGIGALVASGPARLYTINTTTGAATLVGSGPFHQTIGFFPIGMDFNPVVDRIRMISNGGHNLRVNPNDASVIEDARPAFAPGDPHSSNFTLSLAYSNNFAGATSTTLYGIVSGNGPFLATVGSPGGTPVSPNSGLMFTVGQTGLGGYFSLQQSLDISGVTGIAYMVVDNNNTLYAVNLSTGRANILGKFPADSMIIGLSVAGTDDAHPKRRSTRH